MSDSWRQIEGLALGRALRITRREADWLFQFDGELFLCVEASWRLRNSERILLTDSDDAQRFGFRAPIDAEQRANALLEGNTVAAFEHDDSTADLRFLLSDGTTVEILTDSSGYESWQAYAGELLAVGANGGLR